MTSVLQSWVEDIPMMQQSVLITAVRGADGLPKNHVSKLMNRWLRRSFMKMAFGGIVMLRPDFIGGGSFTGPSITPCVTKDLSNWDEERKKKMCDILRMYLSCVDEIPHHYQLHMMHAAEILGYKHPDDWTRKWWSWTYCSIVNDAHLRIESLADMDQRLSDSESEWRAREEVTADSP